MEAFFLYLLKSVIWLSGFAVVFLLFLRNERFFRLKRFYLISGILISFFFPLISFHYQVELAVPDVNPVNFTPERNSLFTAVQQVSQVKSFDFRYILLFLYLAGLLFLFFRLIWHLRSLYKTINKASINNQGRVKLIRASEFPSSFSFFNWVFVNPSVNEAEVEEIMKHELVHVHQKHWFDLLFVELLRLYQWVNPLAWIYARLIRLNHEYIADEEVLQSTSDPAAYRAALLNQMFSYRVISLSDSFNYSHDKKRFDMMKKIITSPYRKMKLLLVLPVFAIVFYSFAKPEYHYAQPVKNNMTVYQAPEIEANVVKGIVVNEEGNPIKGATVIISGTPAVVSTDASGYFTIANVAEEAHLIISSRGCVSQYLEPAFSSEMRVKMLLDKGNPESLLIRDSFKKGPHPLIIINGMESNKRFNEIDENEIRSMGIILERDTIHFGEKGKNGIIMIATKTWAPKTSGNKLAVANAPEQQRAISGYITGDDNSPLPTVTVIIKGTTIGTITDASGHFTMGKVSEDDTLVFSYAGYRKQELKPDFNSEMTVKLLKDPDFKGQVIIRGLSNWQGPAPLVLVDGVEHSFQDMDPNEINSISVLKDASATAVFGPKGTNGVIIVTTKRKAVETSENKPVETATTQQKTISGLVTSRDNYPLRYVAVVIKGTFVGDITDSTGHFTIGNVPEGASLEFCLGGYETQIRKAVFTSKMTVKLLKKDSSDSSFAPTKALLVIDDVVINKGLNEINLNPQDIQSVSIRKDKAATDKYGEKGKAGVIEITTKKKAAESGASNPQIMNQTQAEPAKVVQGTIFNEISEPLSGTNIIISGTTIGTSSDLKGHFIHNNVPDESSLVFSYVGYKSLKLKPDFNNEMIVRMERATVGIAPVVVSPGTKKTIKIDVEKLVNSKPGNVNKDEKKVISEQKIAEGVWVAVEEMPAFLGGYNALLNWLSERTKYPEEAVRNKISGNVIVSFVVKSTGKIDAVKVVKSLNPILDAEAMRVISRMPDWKPGKQGGKPVDVDFAVPLDFRLQ